MSLPQTSVVLRYVGKYLLVAIPAWESAWIVGSHQLLHPVLMTSSMANANKNATDLSTPAHTLASVNAMMVNPVACVRENAKYTANIRNARVIAKTLVRLVLSSAFLDASTNDVLCPVVFLATSSRAINSVPRFSNVVTNALHSVEKSVRRKNFAEFAVQMTF